MRPLVHPEKGYRVIIARHQNKSSEIITLAKNAGLELDFMPCIAIQSIPPASQRLQPMLLNTLIEWILFSSASAVLEFKKACESIRIVVPARMKTAVLAEKTAEAAEKAGFSPDFNAQARNADEFGRRFLVQYPEAKGVLHPCSELADGEFQTLFAQAGVHFERLNLYKPVPVDLTASIRKCDQLQPGTIVFYSPSAVFSFFDQVSSLGYKLPSEVSFVSIGERTAAAIKSKTDQRIYSASSPTTEAVFKAICESNHQISLHI